MLNRVGFNPTVQTPQKNSLSFGISGKQLAEVISKNDLTVFTNVVLRDGTPKYISCLAQTKKPENGVPVRNGLINTIKNGIYFHTGEGDTPTKAFNNLAKLIDKDSVLAAPVRTVKGLVYNFIAQL